MPLPCSQVIHKYNVSVWGTPVQKLVAAVSAHLSYRATNQIQIVQLTGYRAVFKQYLLPLNRKVQFSIPVQHRTPIRPNPSLHN
jgi:hypothetical protein